MTTLTPPRRETVDAKAFRLKGDVRWLSATVATVMGDHGEYSVERLGSDWRCNCRWGISRTPNRKHCSHVLAAALTAPPTQAVPVAPAALIYSTPVSTPVAPPRRLPADQAFGDCNCRLVNQAELYYNRYQCAVIHRVCGRPWSGRRKSPIRIGPVERPAQQLSISA